MRIEKLFDYIHPTLPSCAAGTFYGLPLDNAIADCVAATLGAWHSGGPPNFSSNCSSGRRSRIDTLEDNRGCIRCHQRIERWKGWCKASTGRRNTLS